MRLDVENLCFAYENKRSILHEISFSLKSGDTLCILGPNGSGKTTLLNCLMKLNRPESGTISIDGTTIDKIDSNQIARFIGYVPQNLEPSFDCSVIDYTVTGCAPRLKLLQRPGPTEYSEADKALESLGISYLRDSSYARISGGERQQVSIARALVQRAQIILLDEPTAHLDFGNQMRVLKLMHKMADEGYGIVMTTHNPDHVLMLGGKVAVMKRDGSFTFGDVDQVITEDFLCELYQTELHLVDVPEAHRRVCVAPKLTR